VDEPDAIAQPTFGARFLEEWKRLGGPLSAWSWGEIQELRACDREGLVRALRRNGPKLEYAAIQRIRRVESPEELAHQLWTLAQANSQAQSTLWLLLALMP
jgi:hypothetical protein